MTKPLPELEMVSENPEASEALVFYAFGLKGNKSNSRCTGINFLQKAGKIRDRGPRGLSQM